MNTSYDKAMQDLLHGHSYAMKLKLLLGDPIANDGSVSSYDLATSIVDCFSNAITNLSEIRKSYDDDDQCSDLSSKDSHPQTNHSKRRKSSRTSSSENWRDDSPNPIYDGFLWRKYGEKYIKNSNHQRSYYRCSYNTEHHCEARKHEQKISDNPPVYRTTYFGHHTCKVNHSQDVMCRTVVEDLQNARMIHFGLDQANKENLSCGFSLEVKKEEDKETIIDQRVGDIDQECQDLMEENLSTSLPPESDCSEYSSELLSYNPCWRDPYEPFDLWH